MMANYRPMLDNTIPLVILSPVLSSAYGVTTKTYPSIEDGVLFYGNFKTYGGTERTDNGIYTIEDTAVIESWYTDEITADCRIGVVQTGAVYEIMNEPENVNMRSQFIRFKVRRVKGGA